MQLSVVEAIIKQQLHVRIKLKARPPLTRGGDFTDGEVVLHEEEHLTWDQVVPEKDRYGFQLLDKVRVVGLVLKEHDNIITEGYVVAWHPSKYYPRVYICNRPQLRNGLRLGFPPEMLEKVEHAD